MVDALLVMDRSFGCPAPVAGPAAGCTPTSEETLVTRLREAQARNDRAAVATCAEELYLVYWDRLRATARRLFTSEEDVEDVLQEAGERVCSNASGFEWRSSFSTWVTRIVINVALAQIRRKRNSHLAESLYAFDRDGPSGADLSDAGCPPDNSLKWKELAGFLLWCV